MLWSAPPAHLPAFSRRQRIELLKHMAERYTILEALGSGGFGSVYKAHDTMLHRDVAIKRLDKSSGEDELREQLLREARVLATMQHPNIVSIYDISSKNDCDEIVMELLQGVSLNQLVKRHLLQPSDLRNVAGQILKALAAAHAVGVLHCDLKPENIMLCLADNYYEAKVYDFGMSPPPGEEGGLTKLLGSIYVMAPELFNGEQPNAQSDLYALGCVLYYLLVGEYPFLGDSSVQVMASHITGNYIQLSELRPDISPYLCEWLNGLLEKDPDKRIGGCKAALEALEKIELAKEESELTMSTTLELESKNSRLIRNISMESLSLGGEVAGNNTTAFMSNSFSHSSPVAVKPALPEVSSEKAKSPIDKDDEPVLPEDAEWYFTAGEKVKGPVSLEQLNKLCHEEKVTATTLVWHSLLGDWVTAESCAETKAAFHEKQKKADEEIARIEAARIQAEQDEKEEEVVLKKQAISWLGSEVLIVFSALLITIIFCIIYPNIVHYIIGLYLFVILVAGMAAARVYQIRQGAKWYSTIPVIGDVIYAITRPNTRNTLCAIMIVAGTIGMIIMGYSEAKAIESRSASEMANNGVIISARLQKNQQSEAEEVDGNTAEKPAQAADTNQVPKVEKPVSAEPIKPKGREFPTELKGLREFSEKKKTLKDL